MCDVVVRFVAPTLWHEAPDDVISAKGRPVMLRSR